MKKLVLGLLAIASVMAFMTISKSLRQAEVVKLFTRDATGREYQTELWIVEDRRTLWLRGEWPDSDWLKRLVKVPEVRLERNGELREYRAVVLPKQRPRVNRLMAERYGWIDRLAGLFRNRDTAAPIRLSPRR
jgi:hypothetical protein